MDIVLLVLAGIVAMGRILWMAYDRTLAARRRSRHRDVLSAANEIVQQHERQLR